MQYRLTKTSKNWIWWLNFGEFNYTGVVKVCSLKINGIFILAFF